MPTVLASDEVDQATILMPPFLRTELYTAKVVAQANLEGAYAAEQPDVDGAAWFVEKENLRMFVGGLAVWCSPPNFTHYWPVCLLCF